MKVEAGEPLVHLDPNDARVAYDQAVANLANTVRQVRGLYSTVEAGAADLAAREAQVARRVPTSSVAKASSATARCRRKNSPTRATNWPCRSRRCAPPAATCRATARWSTPRPSAASRRSQAAASQLRQAYLNLQRTAIVAPVSGYVAKRQVQLGQRVQPGANLMTIVPLEQLWVEANFKETQLAQDAHRPAGEGARRPLRRRCRIRRQGRRARHGHRQRVLAAAGAERQRQLDQDRAARAGAHRDRTRSSWPTIRCAWA